MIPYDTHIDFVGKRRAALGLSLALLLISIGAVVARGLNFGIDFTGGVLIEVGYEQAADLAAIRSTLRDAGFAAPQVQNFGTSTDVLIRLLPDDLTSDADEIRDQILEVLREKDPGVELRRVDFVGPQVGEELTEQGGLAMMFALMMILAYVAFRFQWKFAVGAVAALAHDVVITVGFFAVFGLTFDLSVLAAILAVIGYSLNDTIVIFDRIRENFLKIRKKPAAEVLNISINETLARTIMTGVTTLLVLVVLFLLGGETLRSFSVALIVGILIGTYSSVYVASTVALALDIKTLDLMPPQPREGKDVDALP
ncbi:MAG TPA: protein translocase subunit SecF [Gammaproteobacteria bacterium]|nr:protein translocase subunit SecF [Gammaproteobacteria bacterium]